MQMGAHKVLKFLAYMDLQDEIEAMNQIYNDKLIEKE